MDTILVNFVKYKLLIFPKEIHLHRWLSFVKLEFKNKFGSASQIVILPDKGMSSNMHLLAKQHTPLHVWKMTNAKEDNFSTWLYDMTRSIVDLY